MLGRRMKKLLLFTFLSFLWGCTDDYQECYEPFFLNETKEDITLFYNFSGFEETPDTIFIKANDTTYNPHGGIFPFLKKEGLLYDIRLKFHTTPEKCLTYKGNDFHNHDIRDFSSYENLGQCDYCSMRGQSTPDAMLYRITEEMFKQAEPCE